MTGENVRPNVWLMKENQRDNPLAVSIRRFPSVVSKWEVRAVAGDDDGDSDDGGSSESSSESSDNPNDAGDSTSGEQSEKADR